MLADAARSTLQPHICRRRFRPRTFSGLAPPQLNVFTAFKTRNVRNARTFRATLACATSPPSIRHIQTVGGSSRSVVSTAGGQEYGKRGHQRPSRHFSLVLTHHTLIYGHPTSTRSFLHLKQSALIQRLRKHSRETQEALQKTQLGFRVCPLLPRRRGPAERHDSRICYRWPSAG